MTSSIAVEDVGYVAADENDDFTIVRWELAKTKQDSDRIGLGCHGRNPTSLTCPCVPAVPSQSLRPAAIRWSQTTKPRACGRFADRLSDGARLAARRQRYRARPAAPKTPRGLVSAGGRADEGRRRSTSLGAVDLPDALGRPYVYTVYLHFSFAVGGADPFDRRPLPFVLE